MTIIVLGASGGTGRHLVNQALERGLVVRALVRSPERANFPTHPGLTVVRADVHDPASVSAAIGPEDVLLSGLGVSAKAEVGTLAAGARAAVAAHPARIVWLGAMGTGPSASAVSAPIRWMLRTGFGQEYDDKVTADTTVIDAGGIVVHSGILTDKPDNQALGFTSVASMPRRFFPTGCPRATIARLMLDAATDRAVQGGLLCVTAR